MMVHPETYTMTRDEWLKVSRALAGAVLATYRLYPDWDRSMERMERVKNARKMMDEIYNRAADRVAAAE